MDIERLNRLRSRWITWLRTGHLRAAIFGQWQVNKRAMIMDYLYFFASVTAIGLVVGLVWRSGVMSDRFLSVRELSSAGRKSAPPLKKTIGGLTEKELAHIEFQNRIDAWQRDHEVRRESQRLPIPVNGQKYEFTPSPGKTARKRSRTIHTGPVRQQFQLLN